MRFNSFTTIFIQIDTVVFIRLSSVLVLLFDKADLFT